MEVNSELKAAIMEIVENQLKANTPAETRLTLKRLVRDGYSESDAKQLIAQCVTVEIFDVVAEKKPFDEARYARHLRELPKPPFD